MSSKCINHATTNDSECGDDDVYLSSSSSSWKSGADAGGGLCVTQTNNLGDNDNDTDMYRSGSSDSNNMRYSNTYKDCSCSNYNDGNNNSKRCENIL